jgi:NADPH:quinone reductase-like Zn-dependent oxidoreductase
MPHLRVSRADHPLRRPRGPNIVDLPDPVPGEGQQLYEVSAAGVNFADIQQAATRVAV